jgi:multiple sugar transport system ATP-binding protein
MKPVLELEHVSKKFGSVVAVDDISLTVHQGEFVTFLGPSGCGKTTTLRLIAGLENANQGVISIGGQTMFSHPDAVFVPPRKRQLGLVFQNYALWPHMTVFANVAFGLKVMKKNKQEIEEAVTSTLEYMHLSGMENRYPHELSGGQQQRVAVARMIVTNPSIFLMDEPLSNLDAKLRLAMRTEIKRLHNDLQSTTIYVTHDQVEALTMATRVVVMKDGVIQQSASPSEVYERPKNLFVADFVGSPPMNLITGELVRSGDKISLHKEGQVIARGLPASLSDRPVLVAIRPEDVKLVPAGSIPGALPVTVYSVLPAGPETIIQVDIAGQQVTVLHEKTFSINIGDAMALSIPAEKLLFYDKESEELLTPLP